MYADAVGSISGFFTWQYAAPIAEMQPLLVQQGSFTPALAWGNYTAASVMALAALAFVIYRAFKQGEPGIVLLAVWSIITLLAALAMRRSAYYLAINVALLAGYTGWLILRLCGLKEAPGEAKEEPAAKKASRKKTVRTKGQRAAVNPSKLALGIAAVVALVVYPNTGPLPGGDKPFFDVATRALFVPGNAWCESMDWLRINTPEPFGDAAYYYQLYKQAPSTNNNAGPAAAYSVLCWWDYGYWVSRIGHRVPFSNSGASNQGDDWRYFTAQSARVADNICATWNIRYVIVNDYLVDRDSGFKVLAAYTGQPSATYSEIYYRLKQDIPAPTLLYYPEYYRTMAVRLYCFEGKQYEPQETAVISWEAKTGADRSAYKEITGLKTFRTYAEAEVFIAAQKTGNWRIVGKDPRASPVPLEALQGYKLVHQSTEKPGAGINPTPTVKIFEYKP
jgi:dolichyl-diphosphooligosaccharide--protein glycosyltransferase